MIDRPAILAEARSWLRTPFHDGVGIKGHGTDCMWFAYRVYLACGVCPEVKIPSYSPQFLMHRDDDPFLREIAPYSHEIAAPEPGDFVIWKFGRCYAQSAIVIRWPVIIHAHKPAGMVIEDNAVHNHLLARDKHGIRPHKFFAVNEATP